MTKSWSELDLLQGVLSEKHPRPVREGRESISPRRTSSPIPVDDAVESVFERLDEDEREMSFSAPSSPKIPRKDTFDLLRKYHRLRSHSFDDIQSSVNNEEVYSATSGSPHSPARKMPMLQVTLSDSGSESDEETYRLSTLTATEGKVEEDESKRDLEGSTEFSQGEEVSQGGRFTRFKGRLLRTVKLGTSKLQSQTHPGSGSTTSALSEQETEDSDVQAKPQKTQKFLIMSQKFKNSPSLLRRVGVNKSRGTKSPQPQTSENDMSSKGQNARNKSQSKFVDI